ncbi:MAG: hypothetical protein ACT4PL_14905 [Phycisphaerales bacterium]
MLRISDAQTPPPSAQERRTQAVLESIRPVATETEQRLIFPRQALDQAARNRPGKLVHEIERTLDFMQSRLDDLKTEVRNYRFPAAPKGPPPAAA